MSQASESYEQFSLKFEQTFTDKLTDKFPEIYAAALDTTVAVESPDFDEALKRIYFDKLRVLLTAELSSRPNPDGEADTPKLPPLQPYPFKADFHQKNSGLKTIQIPNRKIRFRTNDDIYPPVRDINGACEIYEPPEGQSHYLVTPLKNGYSRLCIFKPSNPYERVEFISQGPFELDQEGGIGLWEVVPEPES